METIDYLARIAANMFVLCGLFVVGYIIYMAIKDIYICFKNRGKQSDM